MRILRQHCCTSTARPSNPCPCRSRRMPGTP
jgi:hypothetical protein